MLRYFRLIQDRIGNPDKLYSIIDAGMISLSRLFIGIAIARVSGVVEFSQYILLISISVILGNLVSSRFITPMANLASGRKRAIRKSVFVWTRKQLRKVQLFGLVTILFSAILWKGEHFGWPILIGFILATLLEIQRVQFRTELQIGFEMKKAMIADGVGLFLMGVVFTVGVFVFEAAVLFFWWGSALGSLVAIYLMSQNACAKDCESTPILNDNRRKELGEIGNTMLIGSVANSTCSRVQPFALSSIGGSLAVASFGAAWTFVGPLRMLTGALGGVLRPRLAMYQNTNDFVSFKRLSRQVCVSLLVAGGVGVIITGLWGVNIMGFVFGESLRSVGSLLPVALAYGTLDSVTSMQMISMQATGKKGVSMATKLRITVAIVSVVLLIPSCYYLGALGAFGSLLVSEALYGIIAFVFIGKCLKHNSKNELTE